MTPKFCPLPVETLDWTPYVSPHPQRRDVYRHDELSRLLAPRSIAIIGASPNPTSFGNRALDGLKDFSGKIFCVNAKYEEVRGYPCFRSIRDIPETVDCAIVAVGAAHVEPIIRECIAADVGGGIVFASGYAETGNPRDIANQQQLADLVAGTRFRMVGPNCLGLVNLKLDLALTFMGDLDLPSAEGPGIGIVSQSGAIGLGLAQAAKSGARISHAFTAGNSSDVDVADLVSYLAGAPDCGAIACVFEGMAEPQRFLRSGAIARAANKPLVVYKLAIGAKGAEAAMSHTASLAGSNTNYSALFRAAGIVEVESLEALIETAAFLSAAHPANADGVAVLASSGGMAIMAADMAERHRVPLPAPSPATQATLDANVPDFGAATNPCDVTAQVLNTPSTLEACAEALFRDDRFGTLVFPLHYAYPTTAERVELFARLAAKHNKTACIVWASGWLEGTGASAADQHQNIAMFRSMDRCFAAIAQWNRACRTGARSPEATVAANPGRKAQALALLAERPSKGVDEYTAKKLLSLYDIPVTAEHVAQTPEEAVEAAMRIGYPVALKVVSPDILHKSEAGIIALNVADSAQLIEIFPALLDRARAYNPCARLDGVLVQEMAMPGLEIVIGGQVDHAFGPTVLAGLGGVFMELLRDTATSLAPVTVKEAEDMLDSLHGTSVLDGFRGLTAIDRSTLGEIVANASTMIAELSDAMAEFDINPLICNETGIVAVDAVIVCKDGAS